MHKNIALKFRRKPRIAVIGDLMVDRYLQGTAERISPEAPIPVVDIDGIRSVLGGAGNVMSNLAGLDAKVWSFGVVGEDDHGEFIMSDLTARGVSTDFTQKEKGRPTTLKCRIMVGHHQMSRYDIETRKNISVQSISKIIDGLGVIANIVDMIIISDYDKGVMTPQLIDAILRIAKKNNVRVIVDPKIRNTLKYLGVDYLKINLHNAEKVSGFASSEEGGLDKICSFLANQIQCKSIILTKGKDGLSIYSKNKLHHLPSLAKDVYDVTGAGDVMISVLGIALANGYDLRSSCIMGTIAAAIKVGKVGTYSLTLDELLRGVRMYNRGKGT